MACKPSPERCVTCGLDLLGAEACVLCERDRKYQDALASLVNPKGPYTVRLASAGNPDYGQDPNRSMIGVPRQTIKVASIEAASAACRLYIEHYELGGGNWVGGVIKRSNRPVGVVSYNGRVWNGNKGAERLEIKLEPQVPACLASMGCLCAGHMRGLPTVGRCDATERA